MALVQLMARAPGKVATGQSENHGSRAAAPKAMPLTTITRAHSGGTPGSFWVIT